MKTLEERQEEISRHYPYKKTCLWCEKTILKGIYCSSICKKSFRKANRKGTEFDVSD